VSTSAEWGEGGFRNCHIGSRVSGSCFRWRVPGLEGIWTWGWTLGFSRSDGLTLLTSLTPWHASRSPPLTLTLTSQSRQAR
jgi:hypothetical protein